ncbi:MAG: diguanylate cyclase [Burkholderiaceae bacterium]|nr:diguanylate cyclase [Burkholderiaceae bacterium]
MNHAVPVLSADPAVALRQVVTDLRLSPGVWGEVLLAWLAGVDAGLGIKDLTTGCYVYACPTLAEFFGRVHADMLGRTDAELLDADLAAPLRAADLTAANLGLTHTAEHRIERDRLRREFNVTRVLITTADAAARYLCSIWTEVTESRQRDAQLALALKQLEQQQADSEELRRETQDSALRDTVTGLVHNLHFEDQLCREVDLSSREHREFSLVSIAIDPALGVAKALGASARLRVVEALGRLLRGNTRAMDASCRVTEDRFAVLLSGVGLATAHSRMEGLRRQCATQIVVLDGQDFGFTVTMGVASFPHTARTQEQLLQAADSALAAAQGRGGNHVTLASIRFDAAV